MGKKFTRGETFFGTLKTCQLYEVPQKPLIRFEDSIQVSGIEEEKINPIEFKINQYQPHSYKSGGNTLFVYENREQEYPNKPQPHTSTSNTSTFIIKEPMFLAFDEKSQSKKGKEETSSQSQVNSSSKFIISRNQNELI